MLKTDLGRHGAWMMIASGLAVLSTAAALLFSVVGCGGDGAGGATSAAETSDAVRRVERERLRALLTHNVDLARRLHADDFELINPAGETLSKKAYIDSGIAFQYTRFKPITPIRVRAYGDAAVVRYESDLEIFGSRGRYWHTDLYEKRGGQWQLVWSQATQAP